jgi:hypothetical protein
MLTEFMSLSNPELRIEIEEDLASSRAMGRARSDGAQCANVSLQRRVGHMIKNRQRRTKARIAASIRVDSGCMPVVLASYHPDYEHLQKFCKITPYFNVLAKREKNPQQFYKRVIFFNS